MKPSKKTNVRKKKVKVRTTEYMQSLFGQCISLMSSMLQLKSHMVTLLVKGNEKCTSLQSTQDLGDFRGFSWEIISLLNLLQCLYDQMFNFASLCFWSPSCILHQLKIQVRTQNAFCLLFAQCIAELLLLKH